jgi:hypothetical protein
MRKNAFLNELLFELQKIVQKGIIKGGAVTDEDIEKDIAIAIDAASDQKSPNTSAQSINTVSISQSVQGQTQSSSQPSLLEPRLKTAQINSLKKIVEGVVANVQKYLTINTTNMTQNDLQTKGFTSEQIKAIQKMQKKNKPIEKEEIKGEIILGTSGEADAIVLDKTALVNKQSLTNDDIAIY